LAKVHAVIWPVKLAWMSNAAVQYRRGRKKLLIWS
jgi:hypothetical protein